MSKVVLARNDTGKLEGLDERAARALAKFRRSVTALAPGDTLQFEYRLPRSPKHHKLFFHKLNDLFARQETFDDVERLREWLLLGAAFCHFIPGLDHQLVAIPDSMDWINLEEVDCIEVHRRVDAFVWTAAARRTLWPHMSDERSYLAVNAWAKQFEHPNDRSTKTVAPAQFEHTP